jgi:rubrerythrin
MDYKLFFSTFLLIFLAELGDKTQLAAMARTATAEASKWTVFSAAAAALVLSTLVAVLIGSALTRMVPEHVIRMGAAILFIVFGALLLRDALIKREQVKAAPAATTITAAAPSGLLARVVLRAAAEFEHAAAADYRVLARQATTPAMQALFTNLASEEEAHYERLTHAGDSHGETPITAEIVTSHPEEALKHDVAAATEPVLEHAIAHEEATAAFYEALAGDTPIPALRRIFQALAAEERQHAATLAGARHAQACL